MPALLLQILLTPLLASVIVFVEDPDVYMIELIERA